jgi:phage terminase small subunit
MGKDLNIRQMRFVTEYIKTGIASRALVLAGYHRSTRNALDVGASQLIRNRKVQREIARRKAAMLKKSDITIEKLLSDAEDARQLALKIDQPSAATGAGTLQAKLVGLLIDRKESGAPGDFAGMTTPAEIIAAIRLELGEDAARALEALVSKATPSGSPIAAPPETQSDIPPNATGNGTLQ